MLCLPLLLGLAAPTAAQTHRNLDIQVADAYEGENIIVTLTLSSAPGSVSVAERTFTVSTEVPTAGAVNTCIASHGCTAGSTPAAATDFTALASTNTVVFGANETVKTVTISTATDNLSEGLEVVRINIDYNPGVSDLGIFTASTTQSTGSEFTGRNAFDFTPSVFPTTVLIESYGTISDGTRPAPEISISADTSPVTEGTDASFTVTATPAPRSQSVNLTVTQSGSFVASGDLGSSKTVTIGTSGEATYTVPTQNDSTDEPNGSVTVTVNSGTGYTVASAPNNAATVVVEDDDTAPTNVYVNTPTGKIAEGTTVNFFVGVAQAPATDLTVNYTLGGTATAGTDYTIAGGSPNYSAGTGTFTIPSGTTAFASYVPLTLTGIADNTSDAGETVVITIEAGNDYGLGRGTSTTYTIVEDGGVATFAVSGKPRVGETLTINRTVDDPDGNGTVSNYHWEKRNPGGEWSIIFQTGSTEHLVNSKTYVVRAEDLGMELRGQITYNDDTDLPTTVHTSPVGPIEPASADAPQLVSIKRHEQAFNHPRWAPGLLCPALVWEVKFDKPMPPVHASDFTLTGSSAGLDIFSNLSDFSIVYVVAKCGDLDTVSGDVRLSFASNHNIRDFEGRRLASTTPTETNDNTFTLNPNETRVYFTQENYYVDEGKEAVLTLRLSRLRDTATTINISATPFTATGNGVDYHGLTYSVTIPAYRASGTFRIRTSEDTETEPEESFRLDINPVNLPTGVVRGNAPGATGNDGQAYVLIRDEDTATAKANKEPGLVFDNAHLTWNEADGCGNTGPTYNVKLKTEPLGPVEVFIEDPDDNYRSDYVAKGRLSIDNTPPSAGEQGGAYEIHDDGTYSTHPLPKLDEHTVLHFTPGNWDTYQLVNVKVRCSDHYTAQIPIKHRMYTNYTGDKGKLSHAYPGYSGVVDKGWTVHVYIRESDPPIVVEHLPAPGQTVEVKEGSHLDFEITLSEAAFKHDSSLTVYLSARGGKAAGVKRRDGRAQSCGGPLDDCLIFTPSNRTQWVRLFAIGPGRDELKVEIPQLRWGGLEHVRDWEMRWPVEVIQAGQGSPQQVERAGFETAEAQAPSCVSAELLADAQLAASETWRASGHVERWSRVLAAFGESNAWSNNPMTVAEAQAQADRGLKRWALVPPALECLENPPQEEQPEQAEVQPVTPATPELSLSAGSAVDEGGNATFTVTADPAPATDLTITWTVAQSGEYLAAPGAGSRTVVLTAGTTSTDLSVGTVDDAADEADGSVSVALGTGTGYTVATGKGSAAVAVRDNDEPVVSIAAGNGVTEGAAVSFTVSASPVPVAPLDVTLTVGQSGDFAASGETGSRTVTVPVTGSMTFEVATDDDGADEPDGSVTASVDAGTGYTVAAAPDNAATVAVSDNDAASSGPTLSIADASFKEDQGTVHFTVTLSEPVDHRVTVHYATRSSSPISARAGQDYFEWKRAWGAELWIPAGSTKGRIAAYIYNDSHDEDPETFEMVLYDASDGVSIADGVAVGTITNSDPMPAAWLARFGRAVAEHALRDIADRIAAPRMAGVEGVLAGQALGGPTGAVSPAFAAPDRFSSRVDRRFDAGFGNSGPTGQVMSLRDFMLSSSFTATGAVDMTGGSMAFWGRASEGSFDGREGRVSLSGDTMTALLGADYARGPWLLGMALAESEGKSSYADTGTSDAAAFVVPAGVPGGLDGLSVQAGSGEVEGRLTAVIPYLALEASEHVRLWSAMGQGSGTVTVTPALGGRYEAATSWTMMAAGLRGDLLAPGGHTGPALALTSDALWVRTSSEKTRDLAASESDVSRLRLGLEGSWAAALGGDASLTPKLELGARHDGGDAETGFGVEVGTGLAWVDPKLGLTFDVSARTLLTHDAEGREDRGVAAQLAFDPDQASARGLSLGLTQDWGGQAAGGLDALFSDAPLEDRTGSGMAESRWVAEAAYGLPVFGGRFTGSPHMGLGLATGARDYTLGWRLEPAAGGPAVSFGVQATRRESDGTVPEHTVGFEINARW